MNNVQIHAVLDFMVWVSFRCSFMHHNDQGELLSLLHLGTVLFQVYFLQSFGAEVQGGGEFSIISASDSDKKSLTQPLVVKYTN